MDRNEIIIFELQNMRDCWLRGNLNTSTEFIDYIDERIEILRGRDDLNSNKTPKEFCKNKKELEE